MRIKESELILNSDKSIYHLNLLPEDIADTIITVGDPDRVPEVSKYFDRIELKKQKREFVTHTGYIGKQRLSVVSTGISTDNIDIVFNELDALVNIDLETRMLKSHHKSLNIVRIGTAGALQADIPLDTFVVSQNAIGLDGLAHAYEIEWDHEEHDLRNKSLSLLPHAYAVKGHKSLVDLLAQDNIAGTTITCGGFYGPQGRTLRAQPSIKNFQQKLTDLGAANFEMETAGIYALGKILGHRCCSISAIMANRCTGEFSQTPHETVDKLIQVTLERLIS